MDKIPFEIHDIRVSKSTMGGFGLDIFLRSETQLKLHFQNELQYQAAKNANGNLSRLKNIFRESIDNILKENPSYFYCYSLCENFDECFSHILGDIGDKEANIYDDSMDLIRSCADEKNIEFDGYFSERWAESADTIINFDEEYFEDPDRRDLYVFLSAMVDEEIFAFLKKVFKLFDSNPITKEIIQEKIEYLTKVKGVRF